jgi:hypothetical protein
VACCRMNFTFYPKIGYPLNSLLSAFLSKFSCSFSSLPYTFLNSQQHIFCSDQELIFESYCHDSCMSFIQHIYLIIPFRYYSLCTSFKELIFRNWIGSVCFFENASETNCAKETDFLISIQSPEDGKATCAETLCFGKNNKGSLNDE